MKRLNHLVLDHDTTGVFIAAPAALYHIASSECSLIASALVDPVAWVADLAWKRPLGKLGIVIAVAIELAVILRSAAGVVAVA